MTNEVPELALDILVNQVVHFSDCIILEDVNRYKNWEAFEVRFMHVSCLVSMNVFVLLYLGYQEHHLSDPCSVRQAMRTRPR